jgi:hypothetical protein
MVLWLILYLGLSVAVLLEIIHVPSVLMTTSAVNIASSESNSRDDSLAYHLLSDDLIHIIAARPLFSASRRPYVSSTDNNSSEINITLLCILSSASTRAALIRVESDEKLIRIHEHDFVSNWEVERISTDHLYIRRDGHVRIVSLRAAAPG